MNLPDKVWDNVPGNREYNILQNLSPGNSEPEPETETAQDSNEAETKDLHSSKFRDIPH